MKFLFWAGVLFTAAAPIIIGLFFKDTSTSWVAALCGAFITLMAGLENIAEISLGPVKARMREKIAEAAATIEQLKKVALVMSEGFLTDLMTNNFMGGITLKKQFELHEKITSSLKDIGASSEQIYEAEKNWNKGISIIFHRSIKNAVEERHHPSTINSSATQEQQSAGRELQALLDFDNWQAPSVQQIQAVLDKNNIDLPAVNSLLNDYDHFLKTNEIRNKAEFLNL